MQANSKYMVVSIRSYLSGNNELGEDELIQILSEFSCEMNPDVDRFLKKRMKGSELLELAWTVVEQMQQLGGGMVTFLEADNQPKLLKFYADNGFQRFDTRQAISKDQEPHELVQLLRLL